MATVSSEADEIRRQMAKIRSELHHEMREVVVSASAATDWRSHVRNRPWLAISLAFATGYLVVPRRARPTSVVVVPTAPEGTTPGANSQARRPGRFGWLRWVLGAIGPVAAQAAQSYALQSIENLLINQQPVRTPAAASRRDPASPVVRPDERGRSRLG